MIKFLNKILHKNTLSLFIFEKKLDYSKIRIGFSMFSAQTLKPFSLDLCGIIPPIPTPFHANEDVNYEKLVFNLRAWNQIDFKGYVVFGTNGEGVHLSRDEKIKIVKKVREETPKEKLVIAGTGCFSTRETVELSEKMKEAGADALLVFIPFYYKEFMTPQALLAHFKKIADKVRIPLILYNIPGSPIDLDVEIVCHLSQHPNIIGIKDSCGDIKKISSYVNDTKGNDFQVLCSSGGYLLPSLVTGCHGGICALANILGKEMVHLYNLFKAGKLEEATSLQQKLITPNSVVIKTHGVAGLKKGLSWFGYFGGICRSPILPLSSPQVKICKEAFVHNGFLEN